MTLPKPRAALAALVALALLPGSARAQAPVEAAEPGLTGSRVTLEAVLEAAERRSPRLRAVDAAARAVEAGVADAATLPDPMLRVGVMNVGLPDLDAGMPMSMAPSVELSQRFPVPGTLGLRGSLGEADHAMAQAAADEARWRLRTDVSTLFYELYALDRRLEVGRETLALLTDFQTVARARYASGAGQQTDVLRADVEVARMDAELRRMEAVRGSVTARLNGLLDRPASAPLGAPVLGALPARLPPADTLGRWARSHRPALVRSRLARARADDAVALARKAVWPDVTVGLSYGQRDRGMGTERMGSAMLGFSLPVHAGSRQLAARDEAEARRRVAEAELREAGAQVDAAIGALLAELDAARTLLELYRAEILPEARAAVESALGSYRVGAVDFTTLVDVQMSVNRYEGEHFRLLADYGAAVAALEATVGRTLPGDDPLQAGPHPDTTETDPEER